MAEAAAWAVKQNPPTERWLLSLRNIDRNEEWVRICERLIECYSKGTSVLEFAETLGLSEGVSGYAYHSVPIALYAFARYSNDFGSALVAALNCGGDTDTVGAIVGGLCGAWGGEAEIPIEWRDKIWEWPRTLSLLRLAAERLAEQKVTDHSEGSVKYLWPLIILRNLIFIISVLTHGILRLLP